MGIQADPESQPQPVLVLVPPVITVKNGTLDISPDLSACSSSNFKEVPYPPSHWVLSCQEEELPLHYMNKDKA
jgi:hypothetical protein